MKAATGPGLITLELDIAAKHPAFAGHFPDRPVLPGVVLLAEVLEAVLNRPELAAALGSQPVFSAVKFVSPVGPDSRLNISLHTSPGGIRFELHGLGRLVAQGRLSPGLPAA